MPLSDYTDHVGGGLKLKGVKEGRVKKHKKKKADSGAQDADQKGAASGGAESQNKYGKTEAQLKHEAKQRQRVSPYHISCPPTKR